MFRHTAPLTQTPTSTTSLDIKIRFVTFYSLGEAHESYGNYVGGQEETVNERESTIAECKTQQDFADALSKIEMEKNEYINQFHPDECNGLGFTITVEGKIDGKDATTIFPANTGFRDLNDFRAALREQRLLPPILTL